VLGAFWGTQIFGWELSKNQRPMVGFGRDPFFIGTLACDQSSVPKVPMNTRFFLRTKKNSLVDESPIVHGELLNPGCLGPDDSWSNNF